MKGSKGLPLAGFGAALTASPGLRAEDIFVNLVEVAPENWSFGLGVAQYAAPSAAPGAN